MRTFAISSLIGVQTAYGWWNQGHMIVAKIAEDELQENHPEAFDKAIELLKLVKTRKEKTHHFTESATFADVYNKKMYGDKGKVDPYLDLFEANTDMVNTDAHWHYADMAYFDGITEEEAEDPAMPELNAIVGIRRLQENLKNTEMTREASYRLRCLVHYIGDLHQPLHAVSRFTEKRPYGDFGGNLFYIAGNYGAFKNLHSLWDSGMNKYVKGINPPLNEKEWASVQNFADNIRNEFPRESVTLGIDPEVWAQESYDISVNFAY
jgi:hypothetical protein